VSEIKAFFRHCPSCGRRFHIRLLSKKPIGGGTVSERLTESEAEMESALMHASPSITPLAEGPPILVEIEDFQYAYKCKHCGHEWSEKHQVEFTQKV
jgi:DNA-directed RNA polymerase subunit RPC12/RpoP